MAKKKVRTVLSFRGEEHELKPVKKEKAKPAAIDKPTRRTVEMLFRDYLQDWNRRDDPLEAAYNAARAKEDALEEKLLNNKKLKALKLARERAYSVMYGKRQKVKKLVYAVREQYLARGLTPAVHRQIIKMIETIDKIRR